MHVWLVKAGEALPSDDSKDRQRRMGLLATELVEQGHKVTWFNSTFYHARKIQRFSENQKINISKNYDIQLIWANSYKKNVSLSRLLHHRNTASRFSDIADRTERPDVILCSMPTIELAEVTVKYANENNIPVVIDIRDLWPDIFIEMVPKTIGMVIKPYINRSKKRLNKLLSNCDAITALTDSFLDWGLRYANRKRTSFDRVFNMAYKVEISKNTTCHEHWESYGVEKGDFIVSFFGTLGKQFEFDPIIEAAKELRNIKKIKFIICGDGESMPQIKEKAKDLNNIFFPGWINQTSIHSLLEISSVGLAPYRESINFTMNIPNKFGEYLSSGLPVLLSIRGDMETLTTKYNCGYVYNDGKHLAKLITNLHSDGELLKSMSINANRLFEDRFDANNVYAQMAEYLEGVSKLSKEGMNNTK
jgi:glycosyltransferase involved in cell wall biosynthesis